jgi:hypothetical protein
MLRVERLTKNSAMAAEAMAANKDNPTPGR